MNFGEVVQHTTHLNKRYWHFLIPPSGPASGSRRSWKLESCSQGAQSLHYSPTDFLNQSLLDLELIQSSENCLEKNIGIGFFYRLLSNGASAEIFFYPALFCCYLQTGPAQFGQNHPPSSFSPHQATVATKQSWVNFFFCRCPIAKWNADSVSKDSFLLVQFKKFHNALSRLNDVITTREQRVNQDLGLKFWQLLCWLLLLVIVYTTYG